MIELKSLDAKQYFTVLIAIITLADLTILLNIPFLRQIIGFLCFTFVPGIIILRVLRLHKLSTIETLLYSVGLSIATLMFTGLLMDTLYPLIGISRPISLMPLLITINIVLLALCILSYARDKNFLDLNYFSNLEEINIKEILSPPVLFLCLLPFFSILGAYLVNYYKNNILLLLLIVIISLIVFLIAIDKLIPKKLYPLAVVMIAIALLYHLSLISSYFIGYDINTEYYLFKLVKINYHWDSTIPRTYNAMLSITILPTIYYQLLNIKGIWIFKSVYQIIFSFIPLGLYHVYKKQTDEKIAFLSVFFFTLLPIFHAEISTLLRQGTAELFYTLMIMLMIDREMNLTKRRILFIIFSTVMVVSHYGLSYVYLFCSFLALGILYIMKYKSKIFTIGSVITFSTIALSWYMYISSSAPLNSIVHLGDHMYSSILTDFFNPETRQALSYITSETASPLHGANRILHYITQFFIFIGISMLILKYKKTKFYEEYVSFSITNFAILIACVAVPFFSGALNMSRMYHITLLFLAPFCILGGKTIFELASKALNFTSHGFIKTMSIFLIVFFLFNSGFIYEITGDPHPTSISLNSTGYKAMTFTEQDVIGFTWLSDNIDKHGHPQIYVEQSIGNALSGGVLGGPSDSFYGDTSHILKGAYVYLGHRNIEYNKISLKSGTVFGREYMDFYDSPFYNEVVKYRNKIYDNGGSQVHK